MEASTENGVNKDVPIAEWIKSLTTKAGDLSKNINSNLERADGIHMRITQRSPSKASEIGLDAPNPIKVSAGAATKQSKRVNVQKQLRIATTSVEKGEVASAQGYKNIANADLYVKTLKSEIKRLRKQLRNEQSKRAAVIEENKRIGSDLKHCVDYFDIVANEYSKIKARNENVEDLIRENDHNRDRIKHLFEKTVSLQKLNSELVDTISTAIHMQDKDEAEWLSAEKQKKEEETAKLAQQPYIVPKDAFLITRKQTKEGKGKVSPRNHSVE